MPPLILPWMGWYVWWNMLLPRPAPSAEVVDLAAWRRARRRSETGLPHA